MHLLPADAANALQRGRDRFNSYLKLDKSVAARIATAVGESAKEDLILQLPPCQEEPAVLPKAGPALLTAASSPTSLPAAIISPTDSAEPVDEGWQSSASDDDDVSEGGPRMSLVSSPDINHLNAPFQPSVEEGSKNSNAATTSRGWFFISLSGFHL